VSGDQQLIVFCGLVQDFAARRPCLSTILTEGAVQVRLGNLDGVMHGVAQEGARILAPRGADRDVTQCMARSRIVLEMGR